MANTNQNNADLNKIYTPIKFSKKELCEVSDPYLLNDKDITYLHYHDLYEIGCCLEGNGLFNIENTLYGFEPNDIVIIPPNTKHLAISLQGTNSSWIWIYPNHEFTEKYNKIRTGIYHWSSNPDLIEEVKRLIKESKKSSNNNYIIRMASRLHIIFTELISIQKSPLDKNSKNTGIKTSDRVSRAIQIIYKESKNGLTVENLAKSCNITTSGLFRIFKKELNCSPKVYIDRYKIRMSCGLLKTTDYPIAYISQLIGFTSLSSFNRTFKKVMTLSPRDWLKNILN